MAVVAAAGGRRRGLGSGRKRYARQGRSGRATLLPAATVRGPARLTSTALRFLFLVATAAASRPPPPTTGSGCGARPGRWWALRPPTLSRSSSSPATFRPSPRFLRTARPVPLPRSRAGPRLSYLRHEPRPPATAHSGAARPLPPRELRSAPHRRLGAVRWVAHGAIPSRGSHWHPPLLLPLPSSCWPGRDVQHWAGRSRAVSRLGSTCGRGATPASARCHSASPARGCGWRPSSCSS